MKSLTGRSETSRRTKELRKRERAAVEAVANRFSATWERGDADAADAYLVAAGKRVAIEIRTLKNRVTLKGTTGKGTTAKPGLRFDKVATRVIERLRAALGEAVPDGMTVLMTVTAPIRLASKTTTSLEERILVLLERGSLERDLKDTIHGNCVRVRFLRGGWKQAPKVIGFVHNPDSDPLLLFNMTRDLLEAIRTGRGAPAPRLTGNRWLILIGGEGTSRLQAYRAIYSQLRVAPSFQKILMVLGAAGVESLTE